MSTALIAEASEVHVQAPDVEAKVSQKNYTEYVSQVSPK
jgi:hypothetical protein